MSEYTPDSWVMVRTNFKGTEYYKVLASWRGGYGGSDSWKLSSGTISARFDEDYNGFYFPQVSRSTYICHKNNYGTSSYTYSVFLGWLHDLEQRKVDASLIILPEETDFLALGYK